MKILLTGGSGFIGTAISKKLLEEGYEIIIGDIREPRGNLREYFHFCDVTDPFQVTELVEESNAVIHLAANPSPPLAEKNLRWDLNLNVVGTINVAESCSKRDRRMVFISTAMVKFAPYTCYAISKRTAEMYVQRYIRKQSLDASIVRLWNVYGPTQELGRVIPDFVEQALSRPREFVVKGTGLDLRDFVYIDDVTEGIILVLKKGRAGEVYEIGSGKQVTIRELADTINKLVTGHSVPIHVTKKIRCWRRMNVEQELWKMEQLGWRAKVSLEEGLEKVIEEREKRLSDPPLPSGGGSIL